MDLQDIEGNFTAAINRICYDIAVTKDEKGNMERANAVACLVGAYISLKGVQEND